MSEPLDPLELPLQGSRLIEAGAGTGKTWTIAALYLRLVLGHGGPARGHTRPLLPGEILVMTFTIAATRELSDRIRRRLAEAAACFRGESVPAADDSFLPAVLQDYPDAGERQTAAWRLAMAAAAMDDAAVFTIDAWCQRMLREHAFDSGSLFDEELQPDQTAMLAEAARDYWRQQVYPLANDALAVALLQWRDVAELLGAVKPLLELPLPPQAGHGTLAECIAFAKGQRSAAIDRLKQDGTLFAPAMQAWLDQQLSRSDSPFDSRKLRQATYTGWIDKLLAWSADPNADDPGLTVAARERLVPDGIRASVKPGHNVEPPACFGAFEALLAALPTLPDIATAIRGHAASRVIERLQQLKAAAGAYGFADMLERLDQALDESAHGAQARRLRQRIVDQYPVALVDEFQDTSPVQLRIFDRLYRIAADDPAHALLLIGDPKQSIYGFRGADIHSYLGARRATMGRHHVLGTNHRSTEALVGVVNRLFVAAEQRPGGGAFMFRRDGSASELPYLAVQARGRDEQLVTSAGVVPALTLDLDAELRRKSDSREVHAARCAEAIVALLNDVAAGFSIGPLRQGFKRLRPADIAVLVRTGMEAAAVRQALRSRGVASVYLSDQDTVFASDEARDLLRLLRSVAAPRDVRLARAALATSLLGLSLDELLALATDDEHFDARCDLLRQLHAVWQAQGVLAMLRRALHGFGLPARWLASGDGERRLTNVLHLAELLQEAGAQLEGEQAAIRWLQQQIDAATPGQTAADEQVLRLESDADLVKVVTVHKSKGLEYPVVFLPFAAHFRPEERKANSVVWLPDDQGRRQLDLAPQAEQIAAADRDRQREDLRLLYVALTRARHSLWVGVAALKIGNNSACLWHKSAIGYLLSGAEASSPMQLAGTVQALASAEIRVDNAAPGGGAWPATTRLLAREAPPPLLPAPQYQAHFDRLWSIASYSALVRDAGRDAVAAADGGPAERSARVLRDDEPAEDGVGGDLPPQRAEAPWHRFPRGAFAGNFLHGLLEWLADEDFALGASLPLQRALRRRCERQGWGHRAADVSEWLQRVCTTPLPAVGAALAELQTVRPEMEFWFPSDGLRARAVDDLCRQHVLPGWPRPALAERVLRGMLMGFVDLVFEHGQRCWVLDYKSNALGSRDADYTVAAMEAAMLEHRYDVQAALYLLALHRLLKSRLGAAYAPDRDLGGAVYLFLRGVGSTTHGCFHLAPPLALIEALDALLVAERGAVPGAAT